MAKRAAKKIDTAAEHVALEEAFTEYAIASQALALATKQELEAGQRVSASIRALRVKIAQGVRNGGG